MSFQTGFGALSPKPVFLFSHKKSSSCSSSSSLCHLPDERRKV